MFNEASGIFCKIVTNRLIFTLFVTDYLKRKAKICFNLVEKKNKIYTYGDVGCIANDVGEHEIYEYELKYVLHVYNSSSTPKIMRDINLVFYKHKAELFRCRPKNSSTKRRNKEMVKIDEDELFNVSPKVVYSMKHEAHIFHEEYKHIKGFNKILLEYYDEKKRRKKVKIMDVEKEG